MGGTGAAEGGGNKIPLLNCPAPFLAFSFAHNPSRKWVHVWQLREVGRSFSLPGIVTLKNCKYENTLAPPARTSSYMGKSTSVTTFTNHEDCEQCCRLQLLDLLRLQSTYEFSIEFLNAYTKIVTRNPMIIPITHSLCQLNYSFVILRPMLILAVTVCMNSGIQKPVSTLLLGPYVRNILYQINSQSFTLRSCLQLGAEQYGVEVELRFKLKSTGAAG